MVYIHSVISEDEETQRHGLAMVFIGKDEGKLETISRDCQLTVSLRNVLENLPFRLASNHQCMPYSPTRLLLRTLWVVFVASPDQRVRTKSYGDVALLETQYALMTFGIPVDQLPITSTGNVKVKNHLQWIKTRKAIDKFREGLPAGNITKDCPIIAHPLKHDVLFSRGGNTGHPGNVEYRQDMLPKLDKFKRNSDRLTRMMLRDEIYASVKARGGRFLSLHKEGWWEELPLDEAHEKITTSFYDYNRKRGCRKVQECLSDTCLFLSSNKRQKVVHRDANYGCIF
jgi:hypothetical protein